MDRWNFPCRNQGGAVPAAIRILIVDDEENIRKLLSYSLCKAGYEVVEASDGAAAIDAAGKQKPDIMILDVMMPVMDGYEVIKRMKSSPETSSIPILMLTARASDADKVYGLDIGADDYLTKPFSVTELQARIRALFRRIVKPSGSSQIATCLINGQIRIDMAARKAYSMGNEINLTLKEYELLAFLAENPGTAFTREKLLEQVWGYDYFGDMRTVDVHITHIRGKIGPLAATIIETVRGVGYRMNKPLDKK
jgi:two-component system alkaline phosphatase synthesis response regulator PhoP